MHQKSPPKRCDVGAELRKLPLITSNQARVPSTVSAADPRSNAAASKVACWLQWLQLRQMSDQIAWIASIPRAFYAYPAGRCSCYNCCNCCCRHSYHCGFLFLFVLVPYCHDFVNANASAIKNVLVSVPEASDELVMLQLIARYTT